MSRVPEKEVWMFTKRLFTALGNGTHPDTAVRNALNDLFNEREGHKAEHLPNLLMPNPMNAAADAPPIIDQRRAPNPGPVPMQTFINPVHDAGEE